MAAAFWPLNAEASNDICPFASTDTPRRSATPPNPIPANTAKCYAERCSVINNALAGKRSAALPPLPAQGAGGRVVGGREIRKSVLERVVAGGDGNCIGSGARVQQSTVSPGASVTWRELLCSSVVAP